MACAYSGLWFSSLASRTPLHNDPSDSFLSQLVGSKELILMPAAPAALALRIIGAYGAAPSAGLSEAYGGLAAALLKHSGGMRARLGPGDTLYLPALWLHDIVVTEVPADADAPLRRGRRAADGDGEIWPLAVSYGKSTQQSPPSLQS